MRQSELLANCGYEVVVPGRIDLAQTIAEWNRREQQQATALTSTAIRPIVRSVEPTIAA
jgi:hypothetical protein